MVASYRHLPRRIGATDVTRFAACLFSRMVLASVSEPAELPFIQNPRPNQGIPEALGPE